MILSLSGIGDRQEQQAGELMILEKAVETGKLVLMSLMEEWYCKEVFPTDLFYIRT